MSTPTSDSRPAPGAAITVVVGGWCRRATVRTEHSGDDAFAFDLEPDERFHLQRAHGVALMGAEGVAWARGWNAETAGALHAVHVLSDVSEVALFDGKGREIEEMLRW